MIYIAIFLENLCPVFMDKLSNFKRISWLLHLTSFASIPFYLFLFSVANVTLLIAPSLTLFFNKKISSVFNPNNSFMKKP